MTPAHTSRRRLPATHARLFMRLLVAEHSHRRWPDYYHLNWLRTQADTRHHDYYDKAVKLIAGRA